MNDWQQRILDERELLNTRTEKLRDFINSHAFTDMLFEDRTLMSDQFAAMQKYLEILDKRIERFGNEIPEEAPRD